MTSVGEMKRHVASLVETNRALASDLDVSRAAIAKICRQRDALQGRFERLQSEWQQTRSTEASRAHGAELQARALEDELRRAESERDEFMTQLAEATDAMNEIRDSLRSRLSIMEPRAWDAQPSCY